MLVPRCSTGWSVAKLFLVSVVCQCPVVMVLVVLQCLGWVPIYQEYVKCLLPLAICLWHLHTLLQIFHMLPHLSLRAPFFYVKIDDATTCLPKLCLKTNKICLCIWYRLCWIWYPTLFVLQKYFFCGWTCIQIEDWWLQKSLMLYLPARNFAVKTLLVSSYLSMEKYGWDKMLF